MSNDTQAEAHDSQAGGAEAAPAEVGDAPPDLEAALAAANARADENWNLYLRATAELENLRRRNERELENARKYGAERLAGELLAVVDSLEMGLEAGATASAAALLEGKAATLKLLMAALDKAGVAQLDPLGAPFDPQQHEAMTLQPSATAEPGSVLTVIQKGYLLNGRLLRPARVVVAAEAPGDSQGGT
jgi:molecular chaperone GrpE